jgi:hypothetical protein
MTDKKVKEADTKAKELKAKELKVLFEGESCGLSYNSDDDWFDDEDFEFEFDPAGGNKWFEDAWEAGMREHEMQQRGCVKREENKEEKY